MEVEVEGNNNDTADDQFRDEIEEKLRFLLNIKDRDWSIPLSNIVTKSSCQEQWTDSTFEIW